MTSSSIYKIFSIADYSSNELIRSFYKTTKNIADFRYLGFGKTTEANELSVFLAEQDKRILRIMPNYQICYEKAEGLPHSFIFKGRTQPRMCPILEDFPEIFELISGRFLCKFCEKRTCNYKKQFEKLNRIPIVFSVKENLPLLLRKLKPDVVIIDDVSINQVIHHKEDFEFEAIKWAKIIHSESEEDLNELFDFLLTDRVGEAISFIRNNTELIENEIKWVEKTIYDEYKSGLKEKPKVKRYLKILGVLYEAAFKEPAIFSYKLGNRFFMRICWSDWSLRKYRVIWQTATPTITEKETFAKLGDYEVLLRKADTNTNWRVLQVIGAKYSKSVAENSSRFLSVMREIANEILKVSRFVEEETVLFSARELMDEKLSVLFSTPEDSKLFLKKGHYEKESTSTNSISNKIIELVGGILNKPPLFYLKRPYIDAIEKYAENSGRLVDISSYLVDESIRDDEVAVSVKQELARIFRGDKNVKKLGIVVSGIEISNDGVVPEIGAIVEKYKISDKRNFLKRLRELLKETFAEHVIRECANRILSEIDERGKVKLAEVIERFEKETGGMYSKAWFKKQITSNEFLKRYGLKVKKIKIGKTKPSLFIVRRR